MRGGEASARGTSPMQPSAHLETSLIHNGTKHMDVHVCLIVLILASLLSYLCLACTLFDYGNGGSRGLACFGASQPEGVCVLFSLSGFASPLAAPPVKAPPSWQLILLCASCRGGGVGVEGV